MKLLDSFTVCALLGALLASAAAPAGAERLSIGERGSAERGNLDRGGVERSAPERRVPERVERVAPDRPGIIRGAPASADNGNREIIRRTERAPVSAESRPPLSIRSDIRQDPSYYKERGYVLDRRYRHNHYYPPHGHVVNVLPHNHHHIRYRGISYYYYSGIWYRPYGVHFVVDYPPIGVVVPILPPYYTTLWVGGIPYYYADNVYYAWHADQQGYVVVEAPRESEVALAPATPEQLFIYPKRGQSDQQQATDRYQCHRWSADQTGFDPTQPGGNVDEGQHIAKHDDYRRAMKACLEARNYSVQ